MQFAGAACVCPAYRETRLPTAQEYQFGVLD
jgi:hypothetical protein